MANVMLFVPEGDRNAQVIDHPPEGVDQLPRIGERHALRGLTGC